MDFASFGIRFSHCFSHCISTSVSSNSHRANWRLNLLALHPCWPVERWLFVAVNESIECWNIQLWDAELMFGSNCSFMPTNIDESHAHIIHCGSTINQIRSGFLHRSIDKQSEPILGCVDMSGTLTIIELGKGVKNATMRQYSANEVDTNGHTDTDLQQIDANERDRSAWSLVIAPISVVYENDDSHRNLNIETSIRSTVSNNRCTVAIAVGSNSHNIYLRDNDGIICKILEHGDNVPCLDISGDGSMLVSACIDRLLRIYSTKNGILIRKMQPNDEWIWSVRFGPKRKIDRLTRLQQHGEILNKDHNDESSITNCSILTAHAQNDKNLNAQHQKQVEPEIDEVKTSIGRYVVLCGTKSELLMISLDNMKILAVVRNAIGNPNRVAHWIVHRVQFLEVLEDLSLLVIASPGTNEFKCYHMALMEDDTAGKLTLVDEVNVAGLKFARAPIVGLASQHSVRHTDSHCTYNLFVYLADTTLAVYHFARPDRATRPCILRVLYDDGLL